MGSIEILIILAVRALNFTVMPRSIWFYEFMLYATLFEKASQTAWASACQNCQDAL